EVVSQSERPDRKVYTITDAGRQELERWLAAPTKLELDLRNETYLKLMLAWRLSRRGQGVDAVRVLDGERRECLKQLHQLSEARAQAEREGVVPTMLLLDLAILRLGAFHQWLDRCEEQFRAGKEG